MPSPRPATHEPRRKTYLLEAQEGALIRMLRATATRTGVSVATLAAATRRSVQAQIDSVIRKGEQA